MYRIGLDLAYNTVGIAIAGHKKLLYDSLVLTPKERSMSEFQKESLLVNWLLKNMKPYLAEEHELIIEDIFYQKNFQGFKMIAKMQGAVSFAYYKLTKKEPTFKMAVSARKNLPVRTRASKAEIQIFIVDTFKLGKISGEVRTEVAANLADYQAKKLSGTAFKARMAKVSTRIKNETGVDEHQADAILLTMEGLVPHGG